MKSLAAKNRKGNILTENVIFIILNIAFLSILIVFIFSRAGSAAVLEEKYAKEIALAIDSARPGMIIYLDMSDAIKAAGKNGLGPNGLVKIDGNIVTVDLQGKGGYSYSFFNDVDASSNFDRNKQRYYFAISEK